jgi:co-chaperonin GroES (HSP10)
MASRAKAQSVSKEITKFEVGSLKFWALSDRILVEEDAFQSGYECITCGGKGRIKCPDCAGTTVRSVEGGPEKKCSTCDEGTIRCSPCNGKGGLLVTPDTAQRRPTSGTIVSAGPDCKFVKVGDSILFSNFAGYLVELARAGFPVSLRILHETEILAGMEGHLTLTNLRGKSELTTYTP